MLALAGCSRGSKGAPAIGEAYVGPAVLRIRSDIPLQSPAVTAVNHGDKLTILGRRRRYYRVRTASGAEGWTDERQLLSLDEMAALRDLAERAAKLPSQGQATAYAELNVHTLPSRQSASFVQIKENEKVDVLAEERVPRTDLVRKPLITPAEKKAKAPPRKSARKDSRVIPPPPMPKPPPPPENWLELSKTNLGDDAEVEDEQPEVPPAPIDSWTLVRVADGRCGWVLTRRLTMAIPDEVAQYAERRRIVSYFSLGAVNDGGEKKNTWLWTTSSGGEDYDFDSSRVFYWNVRRHRYETSYIDRNLIGFSPVLLREVEYSGSKYPGFSICVQKKDGTRARREFAVMGNLIRAAGETPCDPKESMLTPAAAPVQVAEDSASAPERSISFPERVKRRVRSWFKK